MTSKFKQNHLTQIPYVLSEPRFATYLQHRHNNRQDALALYQWNLEISAALIVPIQIFEVAIRNAVAEVLENVHTQNWPWTQGFITSLPNPKKGYSARQDLLNVGAQQPTMGKVVAELKFIFWQKMFTQTHDNVLWIPHLECLFPNANKGTSVYLLRKDIHDVICQIRKLRNRIAHHEPIFTRNLQDDYEAILRVVNWRDTTTAQWMDDVQGVSDTLIRKP